MGPTPPWSVIRGPTFGYASKHTARSPLCRPAAHAARHSHAVHHTAGRTVHAIDAAAGGERIAGEAADVDLAGGRRVMGHLGENVQPRLGLRGPRALGPALADLTE